MATVTNNARNGYQATWFVAIDGKRKQRNKKASRRKPTPRLLPRRWPTSRSAARHSGSSRLHRPGVPAVLARQPPEAADHEPDNNRWLPAPHRHGLPATSATCRWRSLQPFTSIRMSRTCAAAGRRSLPQGECPMAAGISIPLHEATVHHVFKVLKNAPAAGGAVESSFRRRRLPRLRRRRHRSRQRGR